jgi:ADP-heptose:LPS heptosyltransferase
MMKSKIFGRVKYFAFRLMPEKWRNAVLAWILRTWYKPPMLVFPWSTNAIRKALVILPEDPVEAFHQIPNYLQIAAHFNSTAFSLFCTGKVSAFFRHIQPNAAFYEYDPHERFLFSREFREWGRTFSKEEFDLCLVMEHSPDISHLYLAGKTAAAVRAGYSEAGLFPFLNIHVNPSPKQPYRLEQNRVLARALGASEGIKVNWTVSKETEEEISHLLRERQIPAGARLIGVDAGLFFRSCGAEWTETLCEKLRENGAYLWYAYCDEEPDGALSVLLSSAGFPVFSNLSPSRSIALIARSTAVISGKSVFFELANMIKKPVVGVFEEKECALYCRETATTKAVAFSRTADRGALDKIVLLANSWETLRKG